MRVRSTVTGGFFSVHERKRQTRGSCAAAWSTLTNDVSYSGQQTVKTITDVITPGFHTLRACGGFLPLNPVTIETITETRTAGSGDESWNFTGGCYRDQQVGSKWSLNAWLVALPPYDEDILDVVVTEAIANSREAIFDALTTAAEMGQTGRLLVNAFLDIKRFARRAAEFAARRGRGLSRKQILKLFSSKWLEYRYGWLPLLYSAEDLVRSLESELQKDDIVSGKSRVVTDLSDTEVKSQYFPSTGTLSQTHTLTGTRTYRGAAYSTIGSPELAKSGLDPLVTGWELIPFSFVVDWFVQVGTWLKAVSPFAGAQELGSMASVKDEYVLEQFDNWAFNAPGHTGSFTGRSTKLEVERYHRFARSGGSLPSWNPRLTKVRIVDLLALVYQGRREIMRILY